MSALFSQHDLEQIKSAVARAEEKTSGEIVPFLISRSDRYDISIWRGASLLSMLGLGIAMLVYTFYSGWGLGWMYEGYGVALFLLVMGLLGALLGAYVPFVKRMLAGTSNMERMVHHRAMRAFVEEEVFNTRDRTGILLFISLLEHRIEVLGDEGINKKVRDDEWVEVVFLIRNGIKKGEPAAGLVEAIDRCGELLERKGVNIRPDDTDELSNELRISNDD